MDINECRTNVDICGKSKTGSSLGTCKNTQGSYKCRCKQGYELTLDGTSCERINPCREDKGNCDLETQNCRLGKRRQPFCNCKSGFSKSSKKHTKLSKKHWVPASQNLQCVDNDECSLFGKWACNSDNVKSVCNNLPGTFECLCSDGYQGDGHNNCEDIDECMGVNAFALCGKTRTCMNTPGKYECVCDENEGFRETILGFRFLFKK